MSREVKIGIIVVISLAAAIFGVTYLKGEQLFEEKTYYYSFYKNIDGLNEGNPIVFNGFKIGQVTKIDLNISNEANFKIEFKITDERLPIPQDSKAKIISSDLFGSKAIEIMLGESSELVVKGDTLMSENELGLAEAVKKELLPLKKKTDQMIDGVDEILENLKLVFDDDATKGLPEAFESMERMMINLERTSGRLDNTVAENQQTLNSIFNNVEGITSNLEKHNEELSNIITNFSSISDSLAKINFAETMQKADLALSDVAEITNKINNGEGTMAMLLNNDSLHNSLVQSNEELQYLLNDLYMNPWRYVHVSIFGKKPQEKYSKRELKQLRELIDEEIQKED